MAASSQTQFKKEPGPSKRPIPEISDSQALIMSWGLLAISGVSWVTVAFNPEYEKTALVINAILLSCTVLMLGVPNLIGKIQGKPLRGKKFFSYLLVSLHFFALLVVGSGHQQTVLWGTFYLWAFAAGALIKQRVLVRTFLPWTLYGVSVQIVAHHSIQHTIVVSCFFIAALCVGNAVLSAVIRAARQRATHQLDAEILRWYEDARDYRLLAGGSVRDSVAPFSTALSHPPEWESEKEQSAKRLKATTQIVRESVFRLLVLSARVLEPDCVVLYLFDESRKKLMLKEQFIRLDDQAHKVVPADKGAIGLCLQKGQPIQLSKLDKNNDLVTHRKGMPSAQHLLVIPIQHQNDIMGVLVFDRARYKNFNDKDRLLAQALAGELIHMLDTERLLNILDDERQDKAKYFQIARAFSGIVENEEAIHISLEACLNIAPLAIAAYIQRVEDENGRIRYEISHAQGPMKTQYLMQSGSRTEDTWIARAIEEQTILPHVDLETAGVERGLIQDEDRLTQHLGDMRIYPLMAQGQTFAALMIGLEKPYSFDLRKLDIFSMLADSAGIAIGGTRLFEALEKKATTDALTGLKNRRQLKEDIPYAIGRARRQESPLSVIMCDIDYFKKVNDTFGHSIGDDVLVAVAKEIQQCTRSTDYAYRYGGEEFCMILETTDTQEAFLLADRIRQKIQRLAFETPQGPLEVTMSFGIGEFFVHGTEIKTVIKSADDALYMAKQKGRNCVVVCPGPSNSDKSISQASA